MNDKEGGRWEVPAAQAGKRLDAALKALSNDSWNAVRRMIDSGKVTVDGVVSRDGSTIVALGAALAIDLKRRDPRRAPPAGLDLVHVDNAVVVVHKPAGISTVPFGDESPEEQRHTLDALVRAQLQRRAGGPKRGGGPHRGSGRRSALGVVQRLDKDTSGLLVFARSVAAKRDLETQLRNHTVHRVYLAIAHGDVKRATHRSRLVKDRGDGLRGSTDNPKLGRPSVTHVEPIEKLRGATLIRCRLETGRTHQIRIHLSEAGHPLCGERVYIRGHGDLIAAPRLMLHAAELGFVHPRSGEDVRYRCDPPADFAALLAELRG